MKLNPDHVSHRTVIGRVYNPPITPGPNHGTAAEKNRCIASASVNHPSESTRFTVGKKEVGACISRLNLGTTSQIKIVI